MDITVKFNHQFSFGAEEINDVGTDGVLPTKMCAVQLSQADVLPQFRFSGRRGATQYAGARLELFGRAPMRVRAVLGLHH